METNKYQEDIERIKAVLPSYPNNGKWKNVFEKELNDLQELIDNYSKLEKAFDKACYEQARNWYKDDVYANEWKKAEEIKEKYLKESEKK